MRVNLEGEPLSKGITEIEVDNLVRYNSTMTP